MPGEVEAAARTMYEAYFPAEGREIPNEWPHLSKRVRGTWIKMVEAVAPSIRSHERQRVEPVIAAARRYLRSEHGSGRPSHPAEKAAGRLFAALIDLDNSDSNTRDEAGQ